MVRVLLTSMMVLGILAASSPAPRAQTPPQEVSVAMLAPSALLWVHLVAEKQGYYTQAGVTVRELRVGDSPALLQAVSSGSVAAGLSLGDLVIRAIDRGAPIVVAGAVLDKAVLRLYAPASVTSAGSLNGKPATAGAVRGGTADLLRYMVKQGGGDAASLKLVSIANSRDRIVALQNKQIDAALLLAPFDTLAEQGGFHALAAYRSPYVETPLILNRAWAAKNHAAAVALVQAMKRAAAWMNDPQNREATVDILAAATNTAHDICEASYDFIIKDMKAVPADLAVTQAGLEDIVTIDAAVNGSTETPLPFKLQTYYDPSFIEGK